ncbi:MAG TPA: SprT family zinc-dependent metalloprotease [Methylomusa anaerophila]|uniref:YgjP-like metallopeptidase domain-containing protein n=1 Tax=Methylomusa anaerophila TaxID=1930071 RepID=A0A348ANT6_9FIRM|nr:SprT family zinc-dependent metalloprotease [Methylomusa anaerophila]BBB92734.1 hypothetical protein MAMMFC1_03429 [Methylomusa anaerophila]HML87413.1 SprT family zinc-dependent metalloprotease [Methylomusa anaerophila]
MNDIVIADQMLKYSISYSKRRKTIKIRLVPPNLIEITAPNRMAKPEIEHLLTSKAKWINEQFSKLRTLANEPVNQCVTEGAPILYQGVPYILVWKSGQSNQEVKLCQDQIIICLPDCEQDKMNTVANQMLKIWLIDHAEKMFHEKTVFWANEIGVCPRRITIRDQKTRWGSCSSLGNINYNWRIIMAPPQVSDYLVVHELCHFIEPNHSTKFWDLVAKYMPDYKRHRDWLTKNGRILSRI